MTKPIRRVRPLYAAAMTCLLLALSGCIFVSPFGGDNDTLREATVEGKGSAKILWLPISGFISDTPGQRAFGLLQQPSTLATITRALDKAEKDNDIAAVVLRINSPGGSVSAADEIHARITRYHKKTKVPVIASLGGVAASGGYYVAMAADTVIAQPTTITGSIGVIILGVNTAGLLDKLGIENQTFTSGVHKDILSPLRGATAKEREIVRGVLDSLFARFVTVVKNARPDLDRSRLDEITDGRIFAAGQARRLGLVDTIGHIADVLARARRAAGVDEARVIRYYRGRSAPASVVAETAAATGTGGVQVGGVPVNLRPAAGVGPQPLYLWRPDVAR